MLIVILTAAEVSITVYSAFEIAKGAKFHQLNFLHLKYTHQLTKSVKKIENDLPIDINTIESDILLIRQQPIDCIEEINPLNYAVMKFINTEKTLTICEKDIENEFLRWTNWFTKFFCKLFKIDFSFSVSSESLARSNINHPNLRPEGKIISDITLNILGSCSIIDSLKISSDSCSLATAISEPDLYSSTAR